MSTHHSLEKLSLLISYLSLIGVWFAIPSVTLLLNKDDRWRISASILGSVVLLLIIAYMYNWHVLFPDTYDQLHEEKSHNSNTI